MTVRLPSPPTREIENYDDQVKSGSATVANGTTTVTVPHPLGFNYYRVLVTPMDDPGSRWWVSGKTKDHFVINLQTAPGADIDFEWQVRKEGIVVPITAPVTPVPATYPDPPIPPSTYSLPATYTPVSTISALKSNLVAGRVVVLENGIYDDTVPLVVPANCQMIARNLLAAEIRCGIHVTGAGAKLQGLYSNVSSTSKVSVSSNIHVEGNNCTIQDCSIQGNLVIPYGILWWATVGAIAERLVFRNHTDTSLRHHQTGSTSHNYGDPAGYAIAGTRLWDLDIDYAYGASIPAGTGWCGIFTGAPLTQGVKRVKARNIGWSPFITTADTWDTTFSHLDLDMTHGAVSSNHPAFYFEHHSFNCIIEYSKMTNAYTYAITTEWDQPSHTDPSNGSNTTAYGPSGYGAVVRHCIIDGASAPRNANYPKGVFLDDGNYGLLMQDIQFANLAVAVQDWHPRSPITSRDSACTYTNVGQQYRANTYIE